MFIDDRHAEKTI